MTFEAYARDWLERQNFSNNIRKTTRQSIDYICRAIGSIEISDVAESYVDRIFTDVQPFNRQIDFVERTFRVLNKLFEEIREKGITQQASTMSWAAR